LTKGEWRTQLLAARSTVSVEVRDRESVALTTVVHNLVRSRRRVCGYIPIGTEPGSPAFVEADGPTVLLPVVAGARALDWAVYTGPGSLAAGPFGLREPTGPRLGAAAIGSADLVLLPALAVDHAGVRLGRGAGHYDRSLPLATPGVEIIAVVRDEEFVPRLPADPHDALVTGVITPDRGLVRLPVV
jgi:5-formyltetrahydrofolate cyclo-ligase